MGKEVLCASVEQLREQLLTLDWTYHDVPVGRQSEKMPRWPGPPDEEILICVHRSGGRQKLFHRHDFPYFSFTYQGEYDSISYRYDNHITIREGEFYTGQPLAGHALCAYNDKETTTIGVLVQRETFFRIFLFMLSPNTRLLHFLLNPATNESSEELTHFKIEDDCNIRTLLEVMMIEYVNKQEDIQAVLKSLALSFLLQVARQFVQTTRTSAAENISEKIPQYMSEHPGTVTFKSIAKHFSYHLNYIFMLLRQELGKLSSEILLKQRMGRAVILLKGTSLFIEEITMLFGYSNSSNFHRAFREYFQYSSREYIAVRK